MSTYLKGLLASQKLNTTQNSDLETHKTEVESFLRQEFGQSPVIKIAGSVSKGTAISESYDLDIVVYFLSTDERTLKEIYDEVHKKLASRYAINPKTSALRITGVSNSSNNSDYHIDVVPGRFIQGTDDVFLYMNFADRERMQTNLKTHINYITQSGCQEIIKLVKLWKVRNDIVFKTFILELFVINALQGIRDKTELENAFKTVMEAFVNNSHVELVDPANTANVVSRTISDLGRQNMKAKAQEALDIMRKHSSDDKWKLIFKETITERQPATQTASAGFAPRSPWSV
jgi:hypothetical protein